MWQSEKNAKEQGEKDAFALAWLREPDPFKAAVKVFGPSNVGRAMQASAEWISDEYVLKRKAELFEEKGPRAFMPDEFEAARKAWEISESARFNDDKLKALRLYSEIMGYIPKVDNSGKVGSGIVAVPVTELDAKL